LGGALEGGGGGTIKKFRSLRRGGDLLLRRSMGGGGYQKPIFFSKHHSREVLGKTKVFSKIAKGEKRSRIPVGYVVWQGDSHEILGSNFSLGGENHSKGKRQG